MTGIKKLEFIKKHLIIWKENKINKSHQFINTIDINVMYHPEFKKGRKIAGEIYSYYTSILDNK